MRTSLSLGTRGKLSKKVKRSLVIASFGFISIALAEVVPTPSVENSFGHGNRKNNTEQLITSEKKQRLELEDKELLTLIEIILKYT
jgi:hypothetical protein